jgi:hypothetical protein
VVHYRRDRHPHLPRSALWIVADLLADMCRASPDGGQPPAIHPARTFSTPIQGRPAPRAAARQWPSVGRAAAPGRPGARQPDRRRKRTAPGRQERLRSQGGVCPDANCRRTLRSQTADFLEEHLDDAARFGTADDNIKLARPWIAYRDPVRRLATLHFLINVGGNIYLESLAW